MRVWIPCLEWNDCVCVCVWHRPSETWWNEMPNQSPGYQVLTWQGVWMHHARKTVFIWTPSESVKHCKAHDLIKKLQTTTKGPKTNAINDRRVGRQLIVCHQAAQPDLWSSQYQCPVQWRRAQERKKERTKESKKERQKERYRKKEIKNKDSKQPNQLADQRLTTLEKAPTTTLQ